MELRAVFKNGDKIKVVIIVGFTNTPGGVHAVAYDYRGYLHAYPLTYLRIDSGKVGTELKFVPRESDEELLNRKD